MMTTYDQCEHCGRLIPEGDFYCNFCRGFAEGNLPDPDRIHDSGKNPMPHHEFPETNQRPASQSGKFMLKGKNGG